MAWWHSETWTIKVTEMRPPYCFCWDAQLKSCWDAPPVTLRVKKKRSTKQKIGEGVVNSWWGGEFGKCIYGSRLFFVSKRMWLKNCSMWIVIRTCASTNILSRWRYIPCSTTAASVAGRFYSKAGIMDLASASVYLGSVILQCWPLTDNYGVYISNDINEKSLTGV